MQYISYYYSFIGKIIITADSTGLTGLCFDKGKNYYNNPEKNYIEKETKIIKETKKWLDIYFSGKEPDFMPVLNLTGTEFRQKVWKILMKIPYGKTTTYKDIAKEIAERSGIKRMSAQAIGGAVGHNKIAIIIPCHRIIGSNGSLTGYAGGIDKKLKLLNLEGYQTNKITHNI